MKTTSLNSTHAPQPEGGYSQAILLEGYSKLLFISGQIPETIGGDVPTDFEGQARQVWSNVVAQLEAAGMTVANLVKVTIYLSSRQYAETNSKVRGDYLQGHAPALTVLIAGIFDEQWLLEVEAIAVA